jgi:HD-like signal output (HDOD) protein
LADVAEGVGATAIEASLRELLVKSEHPNASFFEILRKDLTYAKWLLDSHVHPNSGGAKPTLEMSEKKRLDAAEFLRWSTADISEGPFVTREHVIKQLDILKGFPVVDAIAASFQMHVGKGSASLTQVIDIVSKDAGLTASVLSAAAQLGHGKVDALEEPAVAIGLLGSLRLMAMAKDIPTIEERDMDAAPLNWEQFWTFQLGVSRFAAFACRQLEFKDLAPVAQVAGILHDIGRVLTVKLFPFGIPAMIDFARAQKLTLAAAEERFIGMNSREMGARFAKTAGLSNRFCNVIAWAESPDKAMEDVDLVAVVALARHVCMMYKVGSAGDPTPIPVGPIESSEAWSVLRPRVFPSFDLIKFEKQAHDYCLELRQTFSGREVS